MKKDEFIGVGKMGGFYFRQEPLNLLGKAAFGVAWALMSIRGVDLTVKQVRKISLLLGRKNPSAMPQWLVRAAISKGARIWSMTQEGVTPANRERALAGIRIRESIEESLHRWASAPELTDGEWEYLINILTRGDLADYFFRNVRGTLAARTTLTWERLELLLGTEGINAKERKDIIAEALFNPNLDEVVGVELLRWVLRQPERLQYLQGRAAVIFLDVARQCGADWAGLAEILIEAAPRHTLRGVTGMEEDSKIEFGHSDFSGVPNRVFGPWLTDGRVDREERIKAIKWLGELGGLQVGQESEPGVLGIERVGGDGGMVRIDVCGGVAGRNLGRGDP